MGTTKPKTCLPKCKFFLFGVKAIKREVSGRRKTQTFSRKLESNNLRLSHFRDCERLETTNNTPFRLTAHGVQEKVWVLISVVKNQNKPILALVLWLEIRETDSIIN